jgi:hypothetical protein
MIALYKNGKLFDLITVEQWLDMPKLTDYDYDEYVICSLIE